MPYILKENRPHYDTVIENLIKYGLFNDELIYILFEYCKLYIKPSYNNYKNYCGELEQCAVEIERRMEVGKISIDDILTVDPVVNRGRLEITNDKIDFMKDADIKVNGDLNYILYGFAIRNVKNNKFANFAMQLRLTVKKIEKEILAEYEDQKIIENGDVL